MQCGHKYKGYWGKMFAAQHKFEVEYMRWLKVPKELRFCRHCKSLGKRCIGDEWHFICTCGMFDEVRNVTMGKIASILNEHLENKILFGVTRI